MAPSTDIGSRAVERVSQVLQFLSASPRRGQALVDVADHLSISRQAATRLLDGMIKAGLAVKDPITRRYRLSMQPHIWFRRLALERAPSDFIRGEMINLANETNSIVVYAILDAYLAVGIEEAECTAAYSLVRPATGFGRWDQTVTGKTLVAFSGTSSVQEYLHADKRMSKADITRLQKELETIQREGMCFDVDGDILRVAVPVKDADEIAFATLLVLPRQRRLEDEEKQRIADRALQASVRCSISTGPQVLLTI